MKHDLAPQEDHRHVLQPGEHEAIYFTFTTPDGAIFGQSRTLFAADNVLELVALCTGGRTFAYQARHTIKPCTAPTPDGSGPRLTLVCEQPWERWRMAFNAPVVDVETDEAVPLEMDMAFRATNPPARYRFGESYQQAQHDGTFNGALQIGDQGWEGTWVGGRDHSWGERPMLAVFGTVGLMIPDHLYAMLVTTDGPRVCLGRVQHADGTFSPVADPQLDQSGDLWYIEDQAAGLETWSVRRLAPPLVWFWGKAGQEAIRNTAQPGDLLRDEFGPAVYTNATGDSVVGFLEHSQRI